MFLEFFKKEFLFLKVWQWIVLALAVNIAFGGRLTEYIVEFWGAKMVGHSIDVPFSLCVVIGLFFGEFCIPLALLTALLAYVI